MKLRDRIALALVAITLVLVAPALFGLMALRELQGIASQLKVRDTGATAVLGRVNTGLEELDYAHSNYVVLWGTSPDTARYWRVQADSAIREKVVSSEIVVIATPTWIGSSVSARLRKIESTDARSSRSWPGPYRLK